MDNLKQRTIKSGYTRICSGVTSLLLRVASMTLLARLLEPGDFGLVAMASAFTGILALFSGIGLGAAAVQKPELTHQQSSTLFWLNVAGGAALSLLCIAMAPLLVIFYGNRELFWLTVALGPGFLFAALGAQHAVILQRQMRFGTLTAIELSSFAFSSGFALVLAARGYGPWALVAMNLCVPLLSSLCLLLVVRWIPAGPKRCAGLGSMLSFGGVITLNTIAYYLAATLDKVLLGRFWGPAAIGLYARAYQLTKIPIDSLNTAFGQVAFSAIARVVDDPIRLRNYWKSGYSLVCALSIPLSVAAAVFAGDIIPLLLGPKWIEAVPLVQLLSGGALALGIANPLSWILDGMGLVRRGLALGVGLATPMIIGSLVGLPWGPGGVALSYSIALLVCLLPVIRWSVADSPIAFADVLGAIAAPLCSTAIAAALVLSVRFGSSHLPVLLKLFLEGNLFSWSYLVMLFSRTRSRSLYLELFRALRAARATT
jgi:O-antigen/teichoic acid export membrane protein